MLRIPTLHLNLQMITAPERDFTGELDALQEVMGEGDQREMLSRLLTKVATLETAIAAAEATRRDLHNQLVQLRGNVRSSAQSVIRY